MSAANARNSLRISSTGTSSTGTLRISSTEVLLRHSCFESWLSHWRTTLWRCSFLGGGIFRCCHRVEEGPEADGFLHRSGRRWACRVAPWACRSCRQVHASPLGRLPLLCLVGFRCIWLDLFRVGPPAQRHLVGFATLITVVVLLDARLTAEVVAVIRHPLLVAHGNAVQVGLAGHAPVEAARYRLVAADAHPLRSGSPIAGSV